MNKTKQKINAILRISADTYNSSIKFIKSQSRVRNHAYARNLAMALMRSSNKDIGIGFTGYAIAQILKRKSHSSVYHAERLIRTLCLEPVEKSKIDTAIDLIKKEFEKIENDLTS